MNTHARHVLRGLTVAFLALACGIPMTAQTDITRIYDAYPASK